MRLPFRRRRARPWRIEGDGRRPRDLRAPAARRAARVRAGSSLPPACPACGGRCEGPGLGASRSITRGRQRSTGREGGEAWPRASLFCRSKTVTLTITSPAVRSRGVNHPRCLRVRPVHASAHRCGTSPHRPAQAAALSGDRAAMFVKSRPAADAEQRRRRSCRPRDRQRRSKPVARPGLEAWSPCGHVVYTDARLCLPCTAGGAARPRLPVVVACEWPRARLLISACPMRDASSAITWP